MIRGILLFIYLNIVFCSNIFSQEKIVAINIATSNSNLLVGSISNLLISILPTTAYNPNVIVSVSDTSLASIIKISNSLYSLVALKEGIVTVNAIASDGSSVSSNVQINIDKLPVDSIWLNVSKSEIEVNQSLSLSASIIPSNATYKDILWTTSDSNVLSISKNGVITGKNLGTSLIRVQSTDNLFASDSFLFTVTKKSLDFFELETDYDSGSDRFMYLMSDKTIPRNRYVNLYNALVIAQKALSNYEFETQSNVNYSDSLLKQAMSQTYYYVDVAEKNILFSANDSISQNITITSTTTWHVNSNQVWLNLNKTTGTGNDLITIVPDKNISNSRRFAELTVIANGIVDTIYVTQEPQYIISVSDYQFHFTSDSVASKSVLIFTNSVWTANSDASWIHLSAQSGVGNDTIVITIDANLGLARTGTITFISEAEVIVKDAYLQTIIVNQDSSNSLFTSLNDTDSLSIYPNPTTHSFSINSKENYVIQLFSSNAKKVLEKNVIGDEIISLDGILTGIYLLKIISKDSVVSKELIVK
jgi:hypothetical protein